MNMIIFTKHALEKFKLLRSHKFPVSKQQVIITLQRPGLVDHSRLPLLIAQKQFDRTHVLRVVYKQERGDQKIMAFYPARIKQYGRK